MKLLSSAVFVGPNVFTPFPVVFLRLDLAGLEDWPSGRLGTAFAEKLLALLPGLDDHASGKGGGGFRKRMLEAEEGKGIPFALLLGHVAVELERRISALGKPRSVLLRGTGRKQEVFFGYESEAIAEESARAAVALLQALLPAEAKAGSGGDAVAVLRDFDVKTAGLAFDETVKLLLRAADRRGIPWRRVAPRGRTITLGQGRRLRRLDGCLTDRTPATTLRLLADKAGSEAALAQLGLPSKLSYLQYKDPSDPQRQYRLLLIGGELVSALELGRDGAEDRVVTEEVHPGLRGFAERAAWALGLEVAGVGYRATDIALPADRSKGVFIGVNADPDLARHAAAQPAADLPGRMIGHLYPESATGRIPLAAVTGTNGKTTTTRMLARILEVSGKTTGFATTDGAYVSGALTLEGDVAGRTGAAALLNDPRIEAAVLETARGGMLSGGAAFDFCDVAAVTNVTADHIGIDGVENLEQLARVKQSVLMLARGRAVVNADDPLCLKIAGGVAARELCLVTLDQDNEAVAEHLRGGGPAVVLGPKAKGEMIVLVEDGKAEPLMAAKEIPATLGGCARHNIQNAMVAAALARGLGIPREAIREALAGFENSIAMSPGRLNFYEGHPFAVAVDYAHNTEGFAVASEALQARYPDRRRIAVLTTLGSRHAEQIAATAKAVAGLYDAFVCGRDDTYSFKEESLRQRGFPAEEIPQRCADAFAAEGVARERLTVAASYREAVEAGLALGRKGDLVVIFTDEPQRTWDLVREYAPGS